jgi:hypothetical protein
MKTLTRAAAALAPPRFARRPIQRALPQARQAMPRKCEAPRGAGSFPDCARASVGVRVRVCRPEAYRNLSHRLIPVHLPRPADLHARACLCARRADARQAAECPASAFAARNRDASAGAPLSPSLPLSYPTGGESALALCSLSLCTKNPRQSRVGQKPASGQAR